MTPCYSFSRMIGASLDFPSCRHWWIGGSFRVNPMLFLQFTVTVGFLRLAVLFPGTADPLSLTLVEIGSPPQEQGWYFRLLDSFLCTEFSFSNCFSIVSSFLLTFSWFPEIYFVLHQTVLQVAGHRCLCLLLLFTLPFLIFSDRNLNILMWCIQI